MELVFQPELKGRYEDQVWEVLCEIDDEFVPPLSSRESSAQNDLDIRGDESGGAGESDGGSRNPVSYFGEMKGQNFVLALNDSRVAGFLTFRHRYECKFLREIGPSNYVTTIGVKRKLRGQGIASRMYDYLVNQLPSGYRLDYISTRTWSTNHAHISILEKKGFEVVERLPNHRGEGIDTIYFAKKLA